MKKRLISLLLAVIMVCSMMPTAFAATDEATQAAQALYELGLFKGTGTNADGTPIFDLDKTPTRNQAIIMLVRLLGKEEEALAGTWDIPFTDVTDAMKPYIGYAYANGLTNGYTATTYNGTAPIKANQYVTFVLRALGYESGNDFEVTSPWELSNKIGITANQYDSTSFTRGDVAIISNSSLDVPCKDGDKPLIKVLGMERLDGEQSEEKPITQLSEAIPGSWSYTRMYNGNVGFQFEYVFCEGNDFFGSRYTMDGVYELYTGTYALKGNQLTIDLDIDAVVDGKIYTGDRQENYTVQIVDGKLALGDNIKATAVTDLPLTDKVNAMVDAILNPTGSGNQTPAEATPVTPTIPTSSDYAYLAGTDFRKVHRQYSSAVAQCAYVYAYVNANGETCVLTDVRYKIRSNFSEFTLHNMTTGEVIENPDSYYDKQADRAYGANRITYMDYANEIRGYHVKMLQAMSNVLKTGTNNWDGAYVSPLNTIFSSVPSKTHEPMQSSHTMFNVLELINLGIG